jgi:hypothetical protein
VDSITPKICSVEGCEKKVIAKRLCQAHYRKLRIYGSALGGINYETHGLKGTPEYNSWQMAKGRCYNKNNEHYQYYGERGIKMAPEWVESFSTFYQDMGPKPLPELTLERKDVNGDYTKDNCEWNTWEVQANNKRNNLLITIGDETKTEAQWARSSGIIRATLQSRINSGWSEDKLLNDIRVVKHATINGVTRTLTEWAEVSGINRDTIKRRIYAGWDNSRLLDPAVKTRDYKRKSN